MRKYCNWETNSCDADKIFGNIFGNSRDILDSQYPVIETKINRNVYHGMIGTSS